MSNFVIAASEAKARFFELLDRVGRGESFSITLRGEVTAKLVPVNRPSLTDIRETISRIKASRTRLNPPGKAKLNLNDLVALGRR